MEIKQKGHIILLAGIVAAAFFLRFHVQNSGIPSYAFMRHDEIHYIPQVIAFLNGDFEVHYFVNPTLYSYLLYGTTAVLGWISTLAGSFPSFEEFSLHVTFNPYLIFILGRILSIAASTASVVLIYLITKRLFSGKAALVASAALAVNLSFVRRAPLAGNESVTVFMILLFFLCLLSWLRSPGPYKSALCGFLLGLTGAVKYNAMIMIIPLCAAFLILTWEEARGREGFKNRAIGLCRAWVRPKYIPVFPAVAAGFAAACPYALLNMGDFLRGFNKIYSFLHGGYTVADRERQVSGFVWYIREFADANNGLIFALICGAGVSAVLYLAVVRRESRFILLIASILPIYLFLGTGIFHRMRFLLPAIPFILAAGAWIFEKTIDAAVRTISRLRKREVRIHAALNFGIYLILAGLVLGPPGTRTYRSMEENCGKTDPRRNLVLWIRNNINPGERVVELANPSRNAFADTKERMELFGYKEEWFDTESRKEAYQRFKESLYSFTPLTSFFFEMTSLEQLKKGFENRGFTRLLVTMHPQGFFRLKDLPKINSIPAFLEGDLWEEFVDDLMKQTPIAKVFAEDKKLLMVVYEL